MLASLAVVVLIFAVIQRAVADLKEKEPSASFNPLDLPKVNDPRVVDRVESAFGIAVGTIFTLVFLYWLQVGGLTLRFNPSDPGEVIPVSIPWLIVMTVLVIGQVIVHLAVLRRNRWSAGLILTETVLEVAGLIPLYLVVLQPFLAHVGDGSLGDLAEIVAIVLAFITLISKGAKLARLWNYDDNGTPSLKPKHNG